MELPRSFAGAPARPLSALPPPVVARVRELAGGGEPVAGYLYDPDLAARRAAALRAALPGWARVYFALKANGYPPLVERLAGAVDGFEVASAAEAEQALAAGGPRRIAASGPGKSEAMLAALARAHAEGRGRVVVNAESELELYRISAAAGAVGTRLRVALRINPDRVAVSGALAMGGVPSPFGLPEERVPAAVALARSLPGVDLAGFHVHAVSGNLDAAAHAGYVRSVLEWSAAAAARHGVALRLVDVGGGLGVPFEDEDAFDLELFASELRRLPDPGVEVVVEPGRWIAAPAGWYAAEVTDVKTSYGTAFAVLRGGINHFQLPVSWELRHNFAVVPVPDWPPGRPRPEARGVPVTVVGELCTPEDTLARDVTVPLLRAGDVVVFPNAGAYGFEFAMPAFLGHPPAFRRSVPPTAAPGSVVGGRPAEPAARAAGDARFTGGAP
ncbi:alanine racemase [Allonocardiopsis opalescens]|uniref:Diaminopimelate decarboxylase n=1 Tax=Allonocardiopsis opalescens TaxID=1144618 RepID=A0A2T0QE31_9ACTN|nr:alanine racemase [Allonocardiopsis opalescens]PRY02168.1 diaminopimelate decarboxylase [Allonocardiopsis opalescens]